MSKLLGAVQKLAEDLLRRGLTLFTRTRRNMKSLPVSLEDKALLNARNMAETLRDPLILYFAMHGKLFGMRQARA